MQNFSLLHMLLRGSWIAAAVLRANIGRWRLSRHPGTYHGRATESDEKWKRYYIVRSIGWKMKHAGRKSIDLRRSPTLTPEGQEQLHADRKQQGNSLLAVLRPQQHQAQ